MTPAHLLPDDIVALVLRGDFPLRHGDFLDVRVRVLRVIVARVVIRVVRVLLGILIIEVVVACGVATAIART